MIDLDRSRTAANCRAILQKIDRVHRGVRRSEGVRTAEVVMTCRTCDIHHSAPYSISAGSARVLI
jgi:RNase P subunit RPR2